MRAVVFVLFAAMTFSSGAEESGDGADTYFPQRLTANELLLACTSSSLTDLGRRQQRFCYGFVSGVEEAIRMVGVQSGKTASPGFCVPPEVSSRQLARAYVKYTSRKKPDLDKPASLIVMESLREEFPC